MWVGGLVPCRSDRPSWDTDVEVGHVEVAHVVEQDVRPRFGPHDKLLRLDGRLEREGDEDLEHDRLVPVERVVHPAVPRVSRPVPGRSVRLRTDA